MPPTESSRRLAGLWTLGAILMLALAVTVVIVGSSPLENRLAILGMDARQMATLGVVGLTVVFLLYSFHQQRALVARDEELRRQEVREATLRARLSEVSALLDTSTELASQLDLRGMLRVAVKRVLPSLEADHACILLWHPHRQRLEMTMAAGMHTARAREAEVVPGEGSIGGVFQSGEAAVATTSEACAHLAAELCLPAAPSSAITVPIRFEGTPLGVFCVLRIESEESLTPLHARMLESLSEQCGAAIVKNFYRRAEAQQAA